VVNAEKCKKYLHEPKIFSNFVGFYRDTRRPGDRVARRIGEGGIGILKSIRSLRTVGTVETVETVRAVRRIRKNRRKGRD